MNTADGDDDCLSKNHEKKIERKKRRFQQIISKDSGIICCDEPTEFLAVCNAGLSTGLDREALVAEFTRFGAVNNVNLLRNKSYCFVICANESSAKSIFSGAHAKSRLGQNETVIYLTYCKSVPQADLNDSYEQPLPPGLFIFEEFISSDEEQQFMNLIDWSQDEETDTGSTLKHRQVKHFGYEFRYDNNNIDKSNPLKNPIPTECNYLLWNRLRSKRPDININEDAHQLTVNKYEAGQGIPPHVDTHSAFTDTIISLSLASDIVMEFRKPNVNNSKEYTSHVSVLLPRRSLLIMSGESRYGWKHGIVPRKIDVTKNSNGNLTAKYRSMRISFTFRWLSDVPCHCKFYSICNSAIERQQNNPMPDNNPIEDPSQYELENVHKVYNEIANHFSETRHSPWPKVKKFIDSFTPGSVLIDVGCGNGKYLHSLNDSLSFGIGCDRSEGLLRVCREKEFNVFQCDCLAVPIKSNSVDGCFSIAVIHHLASEDRRKQAISEMIRILRPNGRALIYVWAKNQELKDKSSYLKQNKKNFKKSNDDTLNKLNDIHLNESSNTSNLSTSSLPIHTNRTQFEHADVLVPWKLKKSFIETEETTESNSKTFLRFYHVFDEHELESLCKQFNNVSIEESYYDQGNWCIIFQKKTP